MTSQDSKDEFASHTVTLGKHRILFGVTASVTAKMFLRDQLADLAQCGWDVHLVVGDQTDNAWVEDSDEISLHVIPMRRTPSLRDAIALVRLLALLVRLKPSAVVMGTPKMGLLGTVAASLARVRVRVFVLHGLRWESMSGTTGLVLRTLDRLALRAASDTVAVSQSLVKALASHGISSPRIRVLGSGSASGVDTLRFAPPNASEKAALRQSLRLPADAEVVAFVGRLTRDKGLQELPRIWASVARARPHAWLVVAGAAEPVDDGDRDALLWLNSQSRVRVLGHLDAVERLYRASDLVLMLSHREGLGMVLLEAAACGTPAVAYAVTGVVDAVLPGVTGLLRPRGDELGIVGGIGTLLDDSEALEWMGTMARRRVIQEFDRELVRSAWVDFISGLQAQRTQRRLEPVVPH